MKKNTPYIIIGVVVVLFVLAELLVPKPLDWKVTLSEEDKIPYGAYGLSQVLPGLFPDREIRNANLTLYEADTFPNDWNYLILAESFAPNEADTKVLMEKVASGATAFIAANHFGGHFADTIDISTGNLLFETVQNGNFDYRDSVFISLSHPAMKDYRFAYTLPSSPAYFDSLADGLALLGQNQYGSPVLISKKWGKGMFYLSSTPLAFSNFYLLEGKNHRFIEASLSYLPVRPLFWTEYYQLGRMESPSPLRFILSQPSLRWAYYIGMTSLLLFILFGIKRQQRPIPTLQAPENTSLQFASSIGTLYFQQGDHQNLAQKKIIFLNEHIRTHYQLLPDWNSDEFIKQLAQKSARAEEEIKTLQSQVLLTKSRQNYGSDQLLRLHKAIQSFNRK